MTAREPWYSRYFALLTQRPRLVLSFWSLVIVVLLVAATGLRPSVDRDRLRPAAAHPSTRLDAELERRFSSGERIVVVVERDSPIPLDIASSLVDALEKELTTLPGFSRVQGRLPDHEREFHDNLRHRLLLYLSPADISVLAGKLTDRAIERGAERLAQSVHTDPLGLAEVVDSVAGPLGAGAPVRFVDGYLAQRDLRRFFVLVEPIPGEADVAVTAERVDALAEAIQKVAEEHSTATEGLRIYSVGRMHTRVESVRSWSRDSIVGAALSIVCVYLVFAIAFRRPFAALLALLPIGISVGAALIIGALLFGDVHLVSYIFCVVVIGLGIDFTFHIASLFWPASRLGTETPSPADRNAQVSRALSIPFRGIAIGGATTAIAFFSLIASQYPAIRETGIVIALGLLLVVVATYTLLPTLLSVWPEQRPKQRAEHRSSRQHALLLRCVRRRGLSAGAWLIVGAVATFGVAQLKFDSEPRRIVVRDNRALAELEKLSEELRVSLDPIVFVSSGATAKEALTRDESFVREALRLGTQLEIGVVESLGTYLPSLERQRKARAAIASHGLLLDPAHSELRFRSALRANGVEARDTTNRYIERVRAVLQVEEESVTLESLRERGWRNTIERHLQEIDGRWYAATHVYPRSDVWKREDLAPLLSWWDDYRKQPDSPQRVISSVLLGDAHAEALRTDSFRVLVLALVGVGLVLVVGFRSGVAAIVTLLPAVVGTAIALGTAGFLGIELHLLMIAALPIVLGIAADDGAHVVARLRRGEALRDVYNTAGRPLMLTTVTTAASFLSLLAADNSGIRDFGVCGAVGIVAAYLAAIHLVPVAASLLGQVDLESLD